MYEFFQTSSAATSISARILFRSYAWSLVQRLYNQLHTCVTELKHAFFRLTIITRLRNARQHFPIAIRHLIKIKTSLSYKILVWFVEWLDRTLIRKCSGQNEGNEDIKKNRRIDYPLDRLSDNANRYITTQTVNSTKSECLRRINSQALRFMKTCQIAQQFTSLNICHLTRPRSELSRALHCKFSTCKSSYGSKGWIWSARLAR